MNTSAERDLNRAKELRKTAQSLRDDQAKKRVMDAADRLERRGARKAAKLGRKAPTRTNTRTRNASSGKGMMTG